MAGEQGGIYAGGGLRNATTVASGQITRFDTSGSSPPRRAEPLSVAVTREQTGRRGLNTVPPHPPTPPPGSLEKSHSRRSVSRNIHTDAELLLGHVRERSK